MAHLTPAHLTPAYILAAMDSNCTPSDMLAYNGHHLHQHDGSAFYEDSDSDSSSYSGSSASSFSNASLHIQDSGVPHNTQSMTANNNNPTPPPPPQGPSGNGNSPNGTLVHQQIIPGQAITYHYFCNFPTCDYHSARSDPVKRHRDTHYPDYKPYTCNYCQSSSARRDSTREHCLKQHKDDSENAFRYDGSIPKPEGWIAYEPKRSPWPPILA
ncbi:hypothetical protein EMPS_10210 [Entomortierella parvispora]|uniref:C2H2-type domain-containing protein n=1 Tax=Entomortierella parvispora TaxID=205924 RepID=A0A9P3HJN5_9FUNG|nr:hypothetical protein EMPS_10210 [Entomortierella parvispora]